MLRLEVRLLFWARENLINTESKKISMRACNNLTFVCTHGLWAENDLNNATKAGWALIFAVSQDVPQKCCHLFLRASATENLNYLKPSPNSTMQEVCKFVCLRFLRPTPDIFHSYGDNFRYIVLQILTNTPHLLQFSSEGSWISHNFCDTGNPFIIVIPENPWHSLHWV